MVTEKDTSAGRAQGAQACIRNDSLLQQIGLPDYSLVRQQPLNHPQVAAPSLRGGSHLLLEPRFTITREELRKRIDAVLCILEAVEEDEEEKEG